jgi:hypothetical protein
VRRRTVYLEMSMSLDGFVAGPNVSTEQPMGELFSGKSHAEAERTLQRPMR